MQNNGAVTHSTEPHVRGSADLVIIGNGIAGLTAAIEARRFAPDRTIMLITEQGHPTINTPALKQFAIGKLSREHLLAYPLGIEQTRNIQVVQAHVEELDAQSRVVRLAKGGKVGYGALLLATGSQTTGLPGDLPGHEFDGVLVLHRLRDYLDLRRRLREVNEAVVIGGGIHAAETVMSLLQVGKKVSWLLRGKTCLARVLNLGAAELVLKHVQQAGARVYRETEVAEIVGNIGAVSGVITHQGTHIPCQLVLVCTGTQPLTTLAERCNLPLIHERGRGILVDDQLRTSIAGIYAAGDVAALRNPQTGQHQSQARWYAAVVQGNLAAAMITGQETSELFAALGVPWHATRLGSLSLLTAGTWQQNSEGLTVLTDIGKHGYHRLAIRDDRLIGYLSLGSRHPDGLAVKRVIDAGLPLLGAKEDLLKGSFDIHDYFAQLRSAGIHAASATARPVQPSMPFVRPLSGADSRPATRLIRHTEPLAFPQEANQPRRRSQTEPLRRLVPTQDHETQRANNVEREAARPSIADLSTLPKTPISPLLLPLPSSQRHVRTRNLWSYDTQREAAQ